VSKPKKFISSSKEKSNFYDEIKDNNKVFVLFYTSWCPYSKQFLPIFEEYKNSNPKDCLSVIVDDKPDICEEYVQKRKSAQPSGRKTRNWLKQKTAK
jgi:thiol-disulfide isomerase/thioredoxin